MKRDCPRCSFEVTVEKWVICPGCRVLIHFKFNSKNGKLKKITVHPGKEKG